MSEEMSKPSNDELAPGQRRRSTCTNGVLLSAGKEFVLDGMHTDGRWKYFYDGDKHPFYRAADELLKYSVPVAPASQDRRGERRMEAHPPNGFGVIYPVGCLSCGRKLTDAEAFECASCDEDGYGQRVDAWIRGARDFPRSPSPAPAPVGGEPTISSGTPDKREAGKAGTAAKGAVLATPPVHSYRGVGEMRSPDGTPLSALAAVPCLRSSDDRPAEPGAPSVDEWDLLPDAPRGGR